MKKSIVALAVVSLLCSAVFAQPKLKVVVEAVGAEPSQKPNTLTLIKTKVLEAFVRDGHYTAVAGSEDQRLIDKIIENYMKTGAVDDKQIAALGKRYGASHICAIKSYEVFGTYSLDARLIDIETAVITGIGSTHCDLVNISDLTAASAELVRQLLNPNGVGKTGGYGSGLYWDRESAGNANPVAAELANILKQKVTVSEGTCVSGKKIALESDREPACSEGMVGITCKVNATLVVTKCQGNQKTVLKGTVTGVDKASKDAALKQVMRNAESAKFWDVWVNDLEAKGGK